MGHEQEPRHKTKRAASPLSSSPNSATRVRPSTQQKPHQLLRRLAESSAAAVTAPAHGRIGLGTALPSPGLGDSAPRIQPSTALDGTIQRKKGGDGEGGAVAAGDYDSDASGKGRVLNWITMKRKHIDLTADDKYGHWWTEVSGPPARSSAGTSFGWWPAEQVSVSSTLKGVDGDLNGQAMGWGTADRDPHHGDPAEDMFHPTTTNDDDDTEIYFKILDFVYDYGGEWRWTFGWGQNCHTFQTSLMKAANLSK